MIVQFFKVKINNRLDLVWLLVFMISFSGNIYMIDDLLEKFLCLGLFI